MQDSNQPKTKNQEEPDSPAIQAYFTQNPRAAREQIEAAAEDAELTLDKYCQVLMSMDAVKSICVQTVGIALSVIEAKRTGPHTLKNAEEIVDRLWHANNDATHGLDKMAARIIRAVSLDVSQRLDSFLERAKPEDSN